MALWTSPKHSDGHSYATMLGRMVNAARRAVTLGERHHGCLSGYKPWTGHWNARIWSAEDINHQLYSHQLAIDWHDWLWFPSFKYKPHCLAPLSSLAVDWASINQPIFVRNYHAPSIYDDSKCNKIWSLIFTYGSLLMLSTFSFSHLLDPSLVSYRWWTEPRSNANHHQT